MIDSIKVSNFVLPRYFTSSHDRGGRNDFLGTRTDGKTLRSFRANPGGYIVYFDPKLGEDTDWEPESERSKERLALKRSLGIGRGPVAGCRVARAPRGFDFTTGPAQHSRTEPEGQ